MCQETCSYLTNSVEWVEIPFITYSCSEEGSVPDVNLLCTPCYEQVDGCAICAGDDSCLACSDVYEDFTFLDLYPPVTLGE